jgi:hypothetical protein
MGWEPAPHCATVALQPPASGLPPVNVPAGLCNTARDLLQAMNGIPWLERTTTKGTEPHARTLHDSCALTIGLCALA